MNEKEAGEAMGCPGHLEEHDTPGTRGRFLNSTHRLVTCFLQDDGTNTVMKTVILMILT